MKSLTGAAKLAGVIGHPITHSKSPKLHGFWLKEHGIDGAYVPLSVAPEHLEQALRALPVLGFSGVNVTIPHKNETAALVDEVHPLARRVGAVNTVVVRADGSLEGRNTDVFGFAENLKQAGVDLYQKSVTVLGAGGAARAVIVALQDMGASSIRLVNRSLDKAEQLADEMTSGCPGLSPITAMSWDNMAIALDGTELVVNTTSLGMVGQPDLDINLSPVAQDAVVTDIVYTPLETNLLRQAREAGLKTVDGLGMLLHQARPAFHAFFGQDPTVSDTLRSFVLS